MPCEERLNHSNARHFVSKTGDRYKTIVDPTPGTHAPAIEIKYDRERRTICRVSVSVGAWLFGSNLHLPSERDLQVEFMAAISEFVGETTGLQFVASKARVARLDITCDFRLREEELPQVIDQYRHFRYPKRNTILINGGTVYFDSKGKKLARRGVLYDKYAERLARRAGKDELAMALGLLRYEDRYMTNSAVTDLARSLNLPDHNAGTLLTQRTYLVAMGKQIQLLGLDRIASGNATAITQLYTELGSTKAGHTVQHLALVGEFGSEYYRDPRFEVAERTAKERAKYGLRVGLVSL